MARKSSIVQIVKLISRPKGRFFMLSKAHQNSNLQLEFAGFLPLYWFEYCPVRCPINKNIAQSGDIFIYSVCPDSQKWLTASSTMSKREQALRSSSANECRAGQSPSEYENTQLEKS